MSLRTHSNPIPSLPEYIFANKIGKGTYATVYKAFRKQCKRDVVAIKCVLKSTLSKNSIDNLLTEISILKKVKHEFIVELKDFQWDDNYIYLIFEYCAGGELTKYIKDNKRLSEAIIQHFLQHIAAALKVLRTKHVSHLDLKPQNILLSSVPLKSWRNVNLKIADFGFSQYLRSKDSVHSLRGSPLYMAPEIFLGDHYDARVDLWSIGIIMYECLFGMAPYSSKTFTQLADKIKKAEPIIIPTQVQISDQCRDLLTRLLQRDPDQRITFEEFFSHAFVDLEHMPCPESYKNGVQYIHEAVEKDNAGDYDQSFRLYKRGLQYLIPIYYWGDGINDLDEHKQLALRTKLMEYIERAQVIKQKCNLIVLSDDQLKLIQKAYESVHDGECLAKEGDYKSSLIKYNTALDIAVPLVAQINGKNKAHFYSVVNDWMNQAEEIKKKQQSDSKSSDTKTSKRKSTRSSKQSREPSMISNCDKNKTNNRRIDAISYDKFITDNFTMKDSLFKPNCYVQ